MSSCRESRGTDREKIQFRQTSFRVDYAETDAMGVVYYANYLIWFERGRSSFMREVEYPYTLIEKEGYLLPVAESHVRYRKSARYDDLIRVFTAIECMERSSIRFVYEIRNSEDTLLAQGWTRHGFISRDGRLSRIPDHIRMALCGPPSGRSASESGGE
ncbi:MAG: acyl-CoA thioesterase [Candidatus Wallbacteria bacterium HGW-Wallbacteria-1]|jgi:acyl-CoA thioester hydrolase|uniref:Acyl-CoA thioesterase n=1 Tax=Candidatus Wallbacteria bacterium HGW-Wallbacteria-1 TaxID=2013854 RepID=A0A2N1PTA4_9BACT|nr:MAG: acyl-CoA thioesterase [Candidatus Wallbacteria bacterium HGW-Wallbacteria-1]